MAKKHTSNDDEERVLKQNIQKRFKDMYTGKHQPLSNLSIQEVEALQSRVAELEAELTQKQIGSKDVNAQRGEYSAIPTKVARADQAKSAEESRLKENSQSFINPVLNFFRLPEDQDPSFIRVVRSILIFTLIANTGVLFLTLGIVNNKINIPTILTLSILLVLIIGSLFLTYQKKILPAKMIIVPALIVAITYIAVGANGLHDSSIAGYGLTIVIASLILGTRGTLLASGLAVAGALIVGYSDMTGITTSAMAAKTGLDDILIIAILLTTSGAVLRMLVTRLGESTRKAIAANKELRTLQIGLEQRIADKTHDLELASEVSRTIAEKVTDLSEMLMEAAEMIRSRFDLYYTQIYLTDPSGEKITLHAGTGMAGTELLQRQHTLTVNSGSLNGRAVLEKQAQIVVDTQNNPSFLSNPLLPNTRSEMSIPLIVGGKVVGVLDLQSEKPGALSESNLPAFETVAGQLAIAIQNAALFSETQEARAEVESQMRRFTEQGWQGFLDAIHQGHKIGFGFDESQVIRLKPEALSIAPDADSLHLPISVAGAKIGEIQFPVESERALSASDLELAQSTGAQLAQHVENLRLLAQAEQYRAEAEQAVRRLTHEGWENFLQASGELEPAYLYDLTEVKPVSEKNTDAPDHAVKHPMMVGGEVIGELAVDVTDPSEEAAEVLAAVAEQLSGHIENLRLSELNERRAQREQTLRQITSSLRSSNNPATIMRTAVRELGSIMGRRTVVQLANPQRDKKTGSVANHENKTDIPANQS